MDDCLREAGAREYGRATCRFGAHLIDALILSPLLILSLVARRWGPIPALVGGLAYFVLRSAYAVAFSALRGATPGKRHQLLRIVRQDGRSIGWRAAIMRELPAVVTGAVSWVAVGIALASIDPVRYASLGYSHSVAEVAPQWVDSLWSAQGWWLMVDAAFLFTNPRRRTLHDLIAGTVVVKLPRSAEQALPADAQES